MKQESEQIYLENLVCVEEAATTLGLPNRRISQSGHIVEVQTQQSVLRFYRNINPFNDAVSRILCLDKSYQYEIFQEKRLPTPKSLSLFNPHPKPLYEAYKKHNTFGEIIREVETQFSYPFILKKNRSSMAKGIYLIQNLEQFESQLVQIFNSGDPNNNVVLCQTFVKGTEYRVIGFKTKSLLFYEKNTALDLQTRMVLNDLNPLHHGHAKKVSTGLILENVQKLVPLIHSALGIHFFGADIIVDRMGQIFILEVNSDPMCWNYTRSNGHSDWIDIYRELLLSC